MVLAPKLHPSIPGSLLGKVVVSVLAALLHAPLAVIGEIPATLPVPALPALDLPIAAALLPAAATVAALAAIESLLSARVAAGLADTGDHDPDRELVGQGVASMGASLMGGMPATGAIARTSVNIRSGARSRLASVVHALVLLAVVLVASGPVGRIPLAALGGVLLLTAVRMVHLATVRTLLRSTRADGLTFLITALITVSIDLIAAVIIGVVLAAVLALRSLSRTTEVTIEPISIDHVLPGDEEILQVRLRGPLFFVSADRVFAKVLGMGPTTVVILRMSGLELVDASGARILSDLVTALERRGITVLIKGVREGHTELFREVGVLSALRHQKHLFAELDPAIDHARSHVARPGGPLSPGQDAQSWTISRVLPRGLGLTRARARNSAMPSSGERSSWA